MQQTGQLLQRAELFVSDGAKVVSSTPQRRQADSARSASAIEARANRALEVHNGPGKRVRGRKPTLPFASPQSRAEQKPDWLPASNQSCKLTL